MPTKANAYRCGKLMKDSSDTAHSKHSVRQDVFRISKQYSYLCMARWGIFKTLTKYLVSNEKS